MAYADTSQSDAAQATGAQNASTTINFGSGSIAAPTQFDLTPSQSATAALGSAGSTTGNGGATPVNNQNMLVWVAAGTGVLSLIAVLFLAINQRK